MGKIKEYRTQYLTDFEMLLITRTTIPARRHSVYGSSLARPPGRQQRVPPHRVELRLGAHRGRRRTEQVEPPVGVLPHQHAVPSVEIARVDHVVAPAREEQRGEDRVPLLVLAKPLQTLDRKSVV